jgi:hypothetical protein
MLDELRSKYEERVRTLAGFGHRGSATPHEQAAADYLCGQFQAIGLEPVREAFVGCRSFGGRILVHVLVAAIGASFFWLRPETSIALALVALISFAREHATRGPWLSKPLVRFPSANLVARIPATSPRLRVIVSGHYDTQRTAFIWWLFSYIGPIYWWVPARLKPPLLTPALVMVGQIVISCLAIFIGQNQNLTIANAGILGFYAIYIIFLGDWARGPFVPGAADNASGAATVLALGEAWLRQPREGVELVLLMPGCEESGLLGAAAWANRHRQELGELPTVFLNFDNLGVGPPRFFRAETPLFGMLAPYPPAIVKAAKEVAHELGLKNAGPHTMPGPTDGLAFLKRGMQGMTIVSFRHWGYMPWYHRSRDTSSTIDFDAAWQGVRFGQALLERLVEEGLADPQRYKQN